MIVELSGTGAGDALTAARPGRDPLLATVEAMELRLADLPIPSRNAGWNRRRAALQVLAGDIWADHGGRVTIRPELVRVTIHGITATGAAGLDAALRNWITAARRKLGDAE